MSTGERARDIRTGFAPGVIVAIVLLAVLMASAPAFAHSGLVRSDPADGGQVSVGRTQLTLWYDEPIAVAASRFRLRSDDGTPVPVSVSSAGRVSAFVELETSPLRRGLLVLDWEAVSAVDGHAGSGSLTFGVGRSAPAASGSTSGAPPPEGLVLRWLQLATFMIALGTLVAPRLLRRAVLVDPEGAARAMRLGPAAALAALMATLFAIVVGPASADLGRTVATTRWGFWWTVSVLALLAATIGLARRARGDGRVATFVAGAGLVVAAVADTSAGHPAELPSGSVVAVAAATLHLLAAGVWVGTLVVLALVTVPRMRRDPVARRALLATTWRAFSPVAVGSVVVIAITGLYLAGREVPGLHAVTTTWYGAATAAKTLALAAALALAASSTLLVNPGLARAVARHLPVPVPDASTLPRRVGAELGVLGVAVLLAAVMTSVPAAREAESDTPSDVASGMVDGLFVGFESVPADAGERRIVVKVNAVTRPQPGPVTGVETWLSTGGRPSSSVALHRVEPGRYQATVPGPTGARVWVTIHRTSAPDAVAVLTGYDGSRRAVGASHVEVATTALAGALALGASLSLLLLLRRHRPRPTLLASDPVSTPGPGRVVVGAGAPGTSGSHDG